jgi:hypothetical protein
MKRLATTSTVVARKPHNSNSVKRRRRVEASHGSCWHRGAQDELIVADPGFAPMYGMRTRPVKTDLRDARALAEACRSGTYRLAHRRSEQQRRVTTRLVVREALVRSRTSFISVVRALLRKDGLRAPTGSAEHSPERIARMGLRDGFRARWRRSWPPS